MSTRILVATTFRINKYKKNCICHARFGTRRSQTIPWINNLDEYSIPPFFFQYYFVCGSIENFPTPFLPGSRNFELFSWGWMEKWPLPLRLAFENRLHQQKLACRTSIRMFSFHKITRISGNVIGIVWSKLLF